MPAHGQDRTRSPLPSRGGMSSSSPTGETNLPFARHVLVEQSHWRARRPGLSTATACWKARFDGWGGGRLNSHTHLKPPPVHIARCGPVGFFVVRGSTTAPAHGGPSGGMREGRVLSRDSASTPSCMNRSCQRQTQLLFLPVRRVISTVPSPAAVNRLIRARQACLCGLFRSATIASSRARSAALMWTTTSLRIPQIRTTDAASESTGLIFLQDRE